MCYFCRIISQYSVLEVEDNEDGDLCIYVRGYSSAPPNNTLDNIALEYKQCHSLTVSSHVDDDGVLCTH